MPETVARLPYTLAIDPCGRCGAWGWELRSFLTFVNPLSPMPPRAPLFYCGECNFGVTLEELRTSTVGGD